MARNRNNQRDNEGASRKTSSANWIIDARGALILLLALIAGSVVGMLTYASTGDQWTAGLAGVGAFAGSVKELNKLIKPSSDR